jgi:hypothetical protein
VSRTADLGRSHRNVGRDHARGVPRKGEGCVRFTRTRDWRQETTQDGISDGVAPSMAEPR